jgi:hypothetical protein
LILLGALDVSAQPFYRRGSFLSTCQGNLGRP